MVIFNSTFMLVKELESDLILWLKGEIIKLQRTGGLTEGCHPRVSAMREACGVSHEHADTASVAFQVEFPTIEAGRQWELDNFVDVVTEFEDKFKVEGMVFTSFFEVV
ncbi:MAG: DUF4286 family protein [Muribaculaceae bacterium]|nr:DUF4286 family protein [Muribaculaceae bacterium]